MQWSEKYFEWNISTFVQQLLENSYDISIFEVLSISISWHNTLNPLHLLFRFRIIIQNMIDCNMLLKLYINLLI